MGNPSSPDTSRAERIYDLHGLLEVRIAGDVHPEIVGRIDLQIGAFRVDAGKSSDPPRRLWIGPPTGEASARSASDVETLFHAGHGIPGERFAEPTTRLAVAVTDRGLAVRAGYANVPINVYLQVLLAPLGYSMVHAAAYQSASGTVTVLAGAGGIGKTSVLGYAVRERKLKYLGDDVVILGSSGECLAFPRAFVLKNYHRAEFAEAFRELSLPRWNLQGVTRRLLGNATFVDMAKRMLQKRGVYQKIADLLRLRPYLAMVPPDRLFGKGSMLERGRIGRIAHLDRTTGRRFEVRPIDTKGLVNRLYSIIHYEWKDFLTHLVTLGAMNVVDLPAYCEQVTAALRGAVEHSEALHVCVPEDAPPAALCEFLGRHGFF